MQYFRLVSIVEGISYLLILSVTAGFISGDDALVPGMGHVILFVLYLVLSLVFANRQAWSVWCEWPRPTASPCTRG